MIYITNPLSIPLGNLIPEIAMVLLCRYKANLAAIFLCLVYPKICVSQAKPPLAPGTLSPLNPAISCYPVANRPYSKQASSCYVEVDRRQLGLLPTVTVPVGTTVEIRVKGRSLTENITFAKTDDSNPPPDIFLATFKQLLPGIQSIAGNVVLPRHPEVGRPSPTDEQSRVNNELDEDKRKLDEAGDRFDCFMRGKVFDENKSADYLQDKAATRCTGQPLIVAGTDPDTALPVVDKARRALVADLKSVKTIDLPSHDVKYESARVRAVFAHCYPDDSANGCLGAGDTQTLEDNRIHLDDKLAKLQVKQQALSTAFDAVDSLFDSGPFVYDVPSVAGKKSKIVITAVDVVTKKTTEITTVEIDRNGSNIILSTGLIMSNLRFKTYTVVPSITGGQQNKDSAGNLLSYINENDTVPSVIAPLALVSYEFWSIRACKAKCGWSISTGIGANLYTKTADFGVGPSFRYRDVLFTPLAHFGREASLTNGFTVGEQFSGTAPTLTIGTDWKVRFGLSVTYRVPY